MPIAVQKNLFSRKTTLKNWSFAIFKYNVLGKQHNLKLKMKKTSFFACLPDWDIEQELKRELYDKQKAAVVWRLPLVTNSPMIPAFSIVV